MSYLSTALFPPHHLVDHARITLYDFHHLGRDILFDVVGHGNAMVTIVGHLYGSLHRLEQSLRVDACKDEASLVECLWALSGCTYADGGERVSDGSKETTLLGQRTTVGNHAESIHLQTVIVVEAQRLMLNDTGIELEPGSLQPLA